MQVGQVVYVEARISAVLPEGAIAVDFYDEYNENKRINTREYEVTYIPGQYLLFTGTPTQGAQREELKSKAPIDIRTLAKALRALNSALDTADAGELPVISRAITRLSVQFRNYTATFTASELTELEAEF